MYRIDYKVGSGSPVISITAAGFQDWTSGCVLEIEEVDAESRDVQLVGVGRAGGRRQLGPGVHEVVTGVVNCYGSWYEMKLH